MNCIAIVDDRPDLRNTLLLRVQSNLPSEWAAIEAAPLATADEYAAWVRENDVAALVLDERLDEQTESATSAHVAYSGHEVLERLRAAHLDLPVFVVTSHVNDDFSSVEAAADGIFNRSDFQRDARTHVSRICRAAQRWLEGRAARLARVVELSSKAASGVLTPEETGELNALRESLAIQVHAASTDVVYRSAALADFEGKLSAAEDLARRLDEALARSR